MARRQPPDFAKTPVVQEYRNGNGLRQLAEKYQVREGRLRDYLKSQDVPLRGKGRPPKKLPTQELVTAYKAGPTSEELARRHGVSHGTVLSRLEAAGIKRRSVGAPRLLTPEQAARAVVNVGSIAAAARTLRVSRNTVRARLREADRSQGNK